MIKVSPFEDIKAGSMATENVAYIDGETIVRIMAACDCPQFRAILALCRFGGLRCPSEIANLETSDIDLQAGRIRVRAHKTKERYLPIFPELRPHIFDNYDPKRKRFIWRFSPTNSNLRKPLLTLLDKAGIDPWPRLFHNLRASCQTDLINSRYPAFQVCRWLGNSETVMQKHYLRETDEIFNRALDDGLGIRLGIREGKLGESERNLGKEKALFPVVLGETELTEYTRRDSNP